MLLKHKKIAGNYRFIRTFIEEKVSFTYNKCYKCKYYHINRNDDKTLCIKPGYWKLNSICTQDDFARISHYVYLIL